ncbi:hypothetical protein [Enterobacteriaceae endosymbiont of Plateumaris rustica]|nr:hypothetical protein [Enterobacteriaceae endosymbiont of Plateumaris rustica]
MIISNIFIISYLLSIEPINLISNFKVNKVTIKNIHTKLRSD